MKSKLFPMAITLMGLIFLFGAMETAQLPKPQVIEKVDPVYPPLARAAHIEAAVRLSVKVTPDGRVESVKVASGHPLLNQAAVEAVYQWRFERTLSGGVVDVTVPFALSIGQVITGKVLDPEGHPMAGVLISAVEPAYQDGRRTWRQVADNAETDDRGIYRIHGLGPGEYFVRAVFRAPTNAGDKRYDHYPPQTYYPGTPDYFTAVPVAVQSGLEAIADIQIPAVISVTVSGKVVAPSDGEPAAGMVVQTWMIPSDSTFGGEPLAPQTGKLNDRSEFSFLFRGVRPGTYKIAAYVRNRPAAESGTRLYSGRVAVDILDKNVENVVLPLHRNVSLRGRLVFAGRLTGRGQTPGLGLRGREGIPEPAGVASVASDGTFIVSNIPEGKYTLAISSLASGAYISDLRLGPQSIYSEGIITVTDQPLEDLQVMIAEGGGTIEGKVQNSQQQGVATKVMLVPEPLRRQNAMFYKTVRSDGTGAFRFTGLPPGEYKLFAWEILPPDGAVENAEFVARYENRGTRVTVRNQATVSGLVVQEVPAP